MGLPDEPKEGAQMLHRRCSLIVIAVFPRRT
jgi:hypothetical protein